MKVIAIKDFDKKKFEEWLKKENKVDNKIAMVEYCAEVLGDEGAKECLKEIKSGNCKDENIEIQNTSLLEEYEEFSSDCDKLTSKQVNGFKKMFEGALEIMEINENPLNDLPEKYIRPVMVSFMNKNNVNMVKLCTQIANLTMIAKEAEIFLDALKSKNEGDEK